ncbi:MULTISPECIES: J domain-containing protein [unclassified Leptolyngbya]|uniref:J domain-containing protein n=1 Tax=unclassified Leptolyngbya TaxID=2650499 RepID=UPI0016867C35|nr:MULTISPECIES: J domain-containing protein [unclassified Leptolyngbya]MBD1911661.1 J domain-containing protein [Leptolyngbya sp. FACHB-8]MBD2154600.1 J domain-containing protein [Leptolyngbya sp. FACHB-16]
MAAPVKPIKVNHLLKAATLEEAIADLSGRFVRFEEGKIKLGKQATDFPLRLFCKTLIEDWQTGKFGYQSGKVTLVFNNAQPGIEADLLIFQPEEGDRFLYTRRTPRSLGQLNLPVEVDMLKQMGQQIQTLTETLKQLTEHQRSLEIRIQASSSPPPPAPTTPPIDPTMLRELLEAQAAMVVGQMVNQVAEKMEAIATRLTERMDALQSQLDQLGAQWDTPEETPSPHSETEWIQRIKETFGTVGDYEQYSNSHRESNAETPLFFTPDWIALCELDWARRLNSTLAQLYNLIHGEDGIGFSGADVLHQFGCHIDPRTGDRYYIYRIGGYSAYEALWQMATHPQYPWLQELERLSKKVGRFREVFKLFGWETEAIAALEQIVQHGKQQRQGGSRSGYSSQQPNPQQRCPGNALSDYLAVLNIGPFTPISLESLKHAYRQAMKTAHPDTGGSKERAQRVNEAYEAIMRHYFPNAI